VTLTFTRTDVPDADSPYKHGFYQAGYPWEASPVGYVMVADKLVPAVFAEIILYRTGYPVRRCLFSRSGLCRGYDNGGT
jgi:hypothetical protein